MNGCWALGSDSILRCHLTSIGNPTVEIRQSYDRLISTMGFPILVRRHLYTLYWMGTPDDCVISNRGFDNGKMGDLVFVEGYYMFETLYHKKSNCAVALTPPACCVRVAMLIHAVTPPIGPAVPSGCDLLSWRLTVGAVAWQSVPCLPQWQPQVPPELHIRSSTSTDTTSHWTAITYSARRAAARQQLCHCGLRTTMMDTRLW